MRARSLLLLTLVGLLALTGVAGAQTPNQDTYNRSEVLGEVGQVAAASPNSQSQPAQAENAEAPVTPATPASSGDLPFTGLEVGGIAAAGLLLLGTGALMRRRLSAGDPA